MRTTTSSQHTTTRSQYPQAIGEGRPRRRNIALALFVCDQLLGTLLERETASSGVRPGEFAVLSFLNAFGAMTPTDVATRLGMAPTTVSTYVRRLESRKLVRRNPNPADGRSYLLELTGAGKRAVQRAIPGFRRAVGLVIANLTLEHDAVQDALADLEDALRAAVEEGT